MADSGGSKTQKQTSVTEPWKPSQGGLIKSITDVNSLYDAGGLQVDYPTTTVAPVAPEQGLAWKGISDRAQAGSPLLDKSQGYIGDVLSGKYLGADAPGMSDMRGRIIDNVKASKSAVGRFGGDSYDAALARELGILEFGNYGRERGAMDSAAALAPTLAREDYYDLDRLGQVGTERRGVAQEFVTDEAARQQWEQQKLANAIALYQSLLAGNMGGSTTAKVPVAGTSPAMQGIGIGASLLGSYLGAGGFQ